MAYYAGAKRPYAKTDVSLRYEQIVQKVGLLQASVWYVTESAAPFAARIEAVLFNLQGDELDRRVWNVTVRGNAEGPGVSENVGDVGLSLPTSLIGEIALVRLRLTSSDSTRRPEVDRGGVHVRRYTF